MAFQNQAFKTQAIGNAGQISRTSPYSVTYGIAADELIKVGQFVQSNPNATNENEIISTQGKAISGNLIGVAVKDKYISSVGDTDIYQKGDNVTILTSGSCFIETSLAALKGQYVFIKNSDGSVAFGNNQTIANFTYTGFIVSIGNATATKGIIEITTAQATTGRAYIPATQTPATPDTTGTQQANGTQDANAAKAAATKATETAAKA